MYEEHFGLKEKPFSIQPDPEYLFWGRGHAMAYAMIEYGILNQAGFTVIIGEIGSGKTTLIRHLLNSLGDDVLVGLVSNAYEDRGQLLQWVLMAFGQEFDIDSHVSLHSRFVDFLIQEYAAGRKTILIVDEAQNLGPKTLEELRMLSNINADKDQLLQIILVGQPQLKDLLKRPELVQFAQRIASDFHLRPLNREELGRYINHRCTLGGADRSLFTDDACDIIFAATKGTPRLINILCDTALVYAFSDGKTIVDQAVVTEVVKDKSDYGLFDFHESAGAEAEPVMKYPPDLATQS